MQERQVDEILQTLEYIKALAAQGRKEMAHMWNYISAFGFYIAVCSLSGALFGYWKMWFIALPFAFVLSTGPDLGWIKSIITWAALTFVTRMLIRAIHNAVLDVVVLLIAIFLGFAFLYGTKKEERSHRAFTVAPRIGIFWGILMGATAFNIACLGKVLGSDIHLVEPVVWPFATGIGYLVTGFFTTWEFIVLGLITIFGVPIVYAIAPNLTYVFYGIIGLLMGLIGFRLKLTAGRG